MSPRLMPFEAKSKEECATRHRNKILSYKKGVVCDIPLGCGFVYIGLTGSCLNQRLTEHEM